MATPALSFLADALNGYVARRQALSDIDAQRAEQRALIAEQRDYTDQQTDAAERRQIAAEKRRVDLSLEERRRLYEQEIRNKADLYNIPGRENMPLTQLAALIDEADLERTKKRTSSLADSATGDRIRQDTQVRASKAIAAANALHTESFDPSIDYTNNPGQLASLERANLLASQRQDLVDYLSSRGVKVPPNATLADLEDQKVAIDAGSATRADTTRREAEAPTHWTAAERLTANLNEAYKEAQGMVTTISDKISDKEMLTVAQNFGLGEQYSAAKAAGVSPANAFEAMLSLANRTSEKERGDAYMQVAAAVAKASPGLVDITKVQGLLGRIQSLTTQLQSLQDALPYDISKPQIEKKFNEQKTYFSEGAKGMFPTPAPVPSSTPAPAPKATGSPSWLSSVGASLGNAADRTALWMAGAPAPTEAPTVGAPAPAASANPTWLQNPDEIVGYTTSVGGGQIPVTRAQAEQMRQRETAFKSSVRKVGTALGNAADNTALWLGRTFPSNK